nr:hypothetical protein [Catenibacterium mitsuokai]
MAIQFLRGTKSAIAAENPVLLAGQPCVETDTGQMKVGNGTTAYNSLPYVGSTGASVSYGSSSTAAGTAAKVATIANYKLVTGALVLIEFTATNTAANPTLNISSTGAKAIYYNGAAVTASYLKAQHIYMMRYNGTQYDIVGDIDTAGTDTKVTNTLNNAAKAFVTGTTSSSTNTGTQVFDSGVFLETVAGGLRVTSLNIGDGARLTYDSSNDAIKITFL